MDFGDILDQWEQGKRKPAANKAGGKGRGGEAARPDPLTVWLRVHGVVDKDAETEAAADTPPERRRRLLMKRPDEALDLHGLTREEAWAALEGFFRAGRQRGFEKLLIIHGKGNHSNGEAVLKRAVRDFIESCPCAGESGRANAEDGGNGATWVLLKSENDYRSR
jgi:DNA-nicking Smr family endonuclease